jgi:hypothetical protein
MSTDLIRYTLGQEQQQQPYCLKCRRVVDSYSIDVKYGLETTGLPEPKWAYTGQDRVTLRVWCHGEEFEKTYYGSFQNG